MANEKKIQHGDVCSNIISVFVFDLSKKLQKLRIILQNLNLKTNLIVTTKKSFSLKQICFLFPLNYLCFFALGLWEGDGGISSSFHKNAKTYKNYQIRLIQQPEDLFQFSYFLSLFQTILSEFANQTGLIPTNQKLGIIEWTSSQKKYLRWRTNNKNEVFILLRFFEKYPPYF